MHKKTLLTLALIALFQHTAYGSCHCLQKVISLLCFKNDKAKPVSIEPVIPISIPQGNIPDQKLTEVSDDNHWSCPSPLDELMHKKAWADFSVQFHEEKEREGFSFYNSDSTDYLYPCRDDDQNEIEDPYQKVYLQKMTEQLITEIKQDTQNRLIELQHLQEIERLNQKKAYEEQCILAKERQEHELLKRAQHEERIIYDMKKTEENAIRRKANILAETLMRKKQKKLNKKNKKHT